VDPLLHRGILEWNAAFELAGFKDALEVRVAPTEAEDPEFSLLDARYSVVRYVASPTRSANSGGTSSIRAPARCSARTRTCTTA
jgi:hypothetical protein